MLVDDQHDEQRHDALKTRQKNLYSLFWTRVSNSNKLFAYDCMYKSNFDTARLEYIIGIAIFRIRFAEENFFAIKVSRLLNLHVYEMRMWNIPRNYSIYNIFCISWMYHLINRPWKISIFYVSCTSAYFPLYTVIYGAVLFRQCTFLLNN